MANHSPGRFQFSLRLMLAAVAAVGLATVALQGGRSLPAGFIRLFLVLAFPAMTATISLRARGSRQAFWTGAFFAALAAFFKHFAEFGTYSVELPQVDGHRFELLLEYLRTSTKIESQTIGLLWLLMPVVGALCALTYWLLFQGEAPRDERPDA